MKNLQQLAQDADLALLQVWGGANACQSPLNQEVLLSVCQWGPVGSLSATHRAWGKLGEVKSSGAAAVLSRPAATSVLQLAVGPGGLEFNPALRAL